MNQRKARAVRHACKFRWGQGYPGAIYRAAKAAYSAQPCDAKDVRVAVQSVR